MEEHTLKLTHVHTQLLLQMQNEKNTQMMDERSLELHNELRSTKAALVEKERKLQAANKTLETKEKDLDTALKELRKMYQNYSQTLETFAFLHFEKSVATCFHMLEKQEQNSLFDLIDVSDDVKLQFPKHSPLVEILVKEINNKKGYTDNFRFLLKNMINGEIYHIDENQLIFKLHLPKSYGKFYIYHHCDIQTVAMVNGNSIIVQNDQLLVFDGHINKKKKYAIYLQIPNYSTVNSTTYLYPISEKGEKLSLENLFDLEMLATNGFKTLTNEVLFQIIKNV